MSNIPYDAESEAYLQRYPDVRVLIPFYGANAARAHYNAYGQNEGRTWGAAPVVAPAAPAEPVETAATRPLPAMYGNDAAGWDAYIDAGRRAAEGINQMPGVFSDYGGVPTDDKAANALFQGKTTASPAASNPLLSGMATGGSAFGAPIGGAMASNALLSPSQQFARILDMGQEAFATPVHQMVDERGGSIAPEDLAFYVKGKEYYGV